MRTYVKTLLVLIAVILYSPVVNAQSGESYGWEQAPRYRGFISEGYVFGTGDVKENRSFLKEDRLGVVAHTCNPSTLGG